MALDGINGIVKGIIFEALDSSYKVIKIETSDNETITLTGNFPSIDLEGNYHFEGQMVIHEKYGLQLKVTSYTMIKHESKGAIISYLSSGKFKGIGVKTATKIVDELGLDAIEKILNDPDILKNIKSIPKSKREEIALELKKNRDVEEIFIKLYSFGLTEKMSSRIYSKYGNLTLDKINKNPYILVHDIDNFGFLKADKLALDMGFDINSNIRVKEALLYTLNNIINQKGDTFIIDTNLIKNTLDILLKLTPSFKKEKDDFIELLKSLELDNYIKIEDRRIYPKYLYNAEVNVATKLKALLLNNNKDIKLDKIDTILEEMDSYLGFSLTENQKKAVIKSLSNKVSIITGGPGTGKTTIIKAILYLDSALKGKAIDDINYRSTVLLLAPTGKASKRMGAACGFEAKTIHKALGYNPEGIFEFNSDNLLKEKFIIVDESSMIDISLMNNLLDAISLNSHIIFVGDKDQLPSVSPGNLLSDLIRSKVIPISILTDILRQKENSNIIKLARMVNDKNLNYQIFNERSEVYFYKTDALYMLDQIKRMVQAFINKGGNLLKDLQILCPMYNGPAGIDLINTMMQETFNQSDKFYQRGKYKFKINDRVLQLQNDPLNKIMNGDEGIIKEITKEKDKDYLYIDFDSHMVKYDCDNLDNLALAYAISIHKSQGSEYKVILLPFVKSFYIMLKQKLLYTAITRAKEKLIILGDQDAINIAINSSDDTRLTSLCERLTGNKEEIKDDSDKIYINDPEIPFETLGERIPKGLTPYSFLDE